MIIKCTLTNITILEIINNIHKCVNTIQIEFCIYIELFNKCINTYLCWQQNSKNHSNCHIQYVFAKY